ncbi:hypothetical protein AFCA_010373 [Aspergillus flavus]|uniref:Uncharacterized protein n=5 Tax=Aspergillus subgen. Circumdati TaxID=2720871 RepID=A0A1S9DIT0_ASPOZ|nr:hypothetical protein AFLA70_223g001141 [Aspergillus flavus AF70]OOO08987.1 hypothetical protein OAory_01102830 [Aspergillus oryzae]QMW46252.1 hypothetical protein G4B11_009707 [Aspergillus flavus]RAQ64778.1 hypothetical protein COH21_004627 [Aspergillus flavus]RAQ75550.1 hypothetical protein COH20_008438 [Aspergillus flavus]
MPPSQGTAGRKKDAIHFVNARPSSERERLKIQRLVRAHVGKWISHQTKDRSIESEANSSRDAPRENASRTVDLDGDEPMLNIYPPSLSSRSSASSCSPESASSHNSLTVIQTVPTSAWDAQPTMSIVPTSQLYLDSMVNQYDNEYDYGHDSQDSSPESTSPPGPIEHIETIGANFIDPFMTYPWRHSPEIANACQAYCTSVLWPTLTPGASRSDVSALNWFPLMMSEPTLMTAITFGSLSHQRVQWLNRWIPDGAFREREQQLLKVCEMETIELINQEMKKPGRAISNAVILSVMCMAHNATDISEERQFRHIPFTAPMRRLQWIDVYGSLRPNLVHVQGLISMINLRGGLEAIDLPGLAPVVSLSDIVTSSAYHTPPVFPFFPLRAERKKVPLRDMLGYTMADVDRHYGRLRQIGLTTEILEVFHAMDLYMSIVDAYLKGNQIRTDYSLLADQRNLVQYTLLSLPAASQLPGFSGYHQRHEIIYEACRLAGCIYGSGVVFPLPPQSTPLAKLSGLLKGVLEVPDCLTVWDQPQARVTLLWVLALGGIAAEGTADRDWYVATLMQTARDSHITCWADLRAIVVLLPWYDAACDDAGNNLWLEIERLSARPSNSS